MTLFQRVRLALQIEAGGVGSGRYVHKKTGVHKKPKIGKDGKIVKDEKHAEFLKKQRDAKRVENKKNAAKGLSVRGKPIVSEKAKRALANMKITDHYIQNIASKCEKSVADAVDGEMFVDNKPLDVLFKDAKGRTHGFEVKAVVTQSNDKITMKTSAMKRKLDFAKKYKLKSVSTVVVDYRKSSKNPTVYYKQGVGSFRVGSMQMIEKGFKGLKELFS